MGSSLEPVAYEWRGVAIKATARGKWKVGGWPEGVHRTCDDLDTARQLADELADLSAVMEEAAVAHKLARDAIREWGAR